MVPKRKEDQWETKIEDTLAKVVPPIRWMACEKSFWEHFLLPLTAPRSPSFDFLGTSHFREALLVVNGRGTREEEVDGRSNVL